jgi:hypothetical protein
VQKQTISYDSPLDALVSITKRLSVFEERYRISSEDFFHRYSAGEMGNSVDFLEWSNAYEHYMAIRERIEKRLRHAA